MSDFLHRLWVSRAEGAVLHVSQGAERSEGSEEQENRSLGWAEKNQEPLLHSKRPLKKMCTKT